MSEVWSTDELGQHCYVKARIGWRGLSSSEYTEDGPYLIAGKHIDKGVIDWDGCDHINDFRYGESWEIALRVGDVILTKDGTIGRVARVDSLPGKATINGTMMLLRPIGDIEYRFLYHLLNGPGFKKLIDDKVSGSSIPHIFQRDMVSLPIARPSLELQLKIADVLDTLDVTIRHTEAMFSKLQQVKQGLLHDLLTRGIDANGELRPSVEDAPHLYKKSSLGRIPKEWDVALLDNVAKRGSGHTPNKNVRSYWNGEVKWVSLADCGKLDKIYIFDTDKTISELGIANSSAVKHTAGTVILSRDAGVGKSAILSSEMTVSQHFMAWNCGLRLNNIFLYFLLQKQKAFFEAIAIGSTIRTIGVPFFKKFAVVLPSRNEQDKVAALLLKAEERLTHEQAALNKLIMTKNALMEDLLTGRVPVTPLLEGSVPQ